jgi:hypothetical protein
LVVGWDDKDKDVNKVGDKGVNDKNYDDTGVWGGPIWTCGQL